MSQEGSSYLEIQVQPRDVRHRVRRLRLKGFGLRVVASLGACYLAFCALGLVLAPAMLRDMQARGDLGQETRTRQRLGRRLGVLVGQLKEVNEESERLQLQMDRIRFIYRLRAPKEAGEAIFTRGWDQV